MEIKSKEKLNIDEFYSENLNKIRNDYNIFLNNFDKMKKNNNKNNNNSKVSQVYYCTMRSSTGSLFAVSKLMGMSVSELKKLFEINPEASFAYQAALIDKRAKLEEDLTKVLVDSTINGQVVKEIKEEFDGSKVKIVKTKKKIPPNPQLALEILKRLDPAKWGDKFEISGNVSERLNIDISGDVNVEIDYRKLSKEAIKEIIDSQKTSENTKAFKREDGTSILLLQEAKKIAKNKFLPEPEKNRHLSDEHKEKLRESYKNKKDVKKENE